jgi:hypothetical protein
MDIETWRAMLERRGYKDIVIEQQGQRIVYSIDGIQGVRGVTSFAQMSYRMMRHEIENQLGHGMKYIRHVCGQPLLRAKAGYTSSDPFYPVTIPLFYPHYYAIPLHPNAQPVTLCPACAGKLSSGTIRILTDPEKNQHGSRRIEKY